MDTKILKEPELKDYLEEDWLGQPTLELTRLHNDWKVYSEALAELAYFRGLNENTSYGHDINTD